MDATICERFPATRGRRQVARFLLGAGLLFPVSVIGNLQARPDFSGEWTRVDSVADLRSVAAVGDAAFRTGTMGNAWGSPLTLRQQGSELVVEYVHFGTYDLQPRLRLVFALDGSESLNTIMIGHDESALRSRAAWRDTTLVITTTYPPVSGLDGAIELRQVLLLESPATLIVETTRAHAGRASAPVRTVYRRN